MHRQMIKIILTHLFIACATASSVYAEWDHFKKAKQYSDLLGDREILVPNARMPWFLGDYIEMPVVVKPQPDHYKAMRNDNYTVLLHAHSWFRRTLHPHRIPAHIRKGEVSSVKDVFFWRMRLEGHDALKPYAFVANRTRADRYRLGVKLSHENGGKAITLRSQPFRVYRVGHHPKIRMNKRIVSDLHLPYTCILPGTNHERGIRLQLTNFGQRHWKRIRVDAVKVSSGKRVRVKLERHEGYSSSEDGKGGSRFELVFPQLNGIKTGRYMLEFRFAQHWWHRPRLQYRSAPMVIFVSQGAAKVQDTLVSALDKVLPDEVNEWLRFGGCRRDTRMLGSSVKTWSKKVKKLPAAIDKHILEPGMNGVKAIAEPIKDVYGDVKDATNNAGDFCRHVLMPTAIGAYRGLKYRRKGYSPGKA